jgi:hypothetical protein
MQLEGKVEQRLALAGLADHGEPVRQLSAVQARKASDTGEPHDAGAEVVLRGVPAERHHRSEWNEGEPAPPQAAGSPLPRGGHRDGATDCTLHRSAARPAGRGARLPQPRAGGGSYDQDPLVFFNIFNYLCGICQSLGSSIFRVGRGDLG